MRALNAVQRVKKAQHSSVKLWNLKAFSAISSEMKNDGASTMSARWLRFFTNVNIIIHFLKVKE